jgi:hypothetical protein
MRDLPAGTVTFLFTDIEGSNRGTPLGQWEIGKEEYANGVLVAHGAEFDLAYAEGRALAFDAAVDEALAKPPARRR